MLFLPLLGFPGGSAGKESSCTVGDLTLISGLGRYPGEGNGYPVQYCGLKKSIGSQRAGHDCMSFTHTTALDGFSSVKADIQDVPTLCWIVDIYAAFVGVKPVCLTEVRWIHTDFVKVR